MGAKQCIRWSLMVLPMVLLYAFCGVLLGFLVHSLKLFNPVAPQNGIACEFFHSPKKVVLAEYIQNRTTIPLTEPDRNCFGIKHRRTVLSLMDVPSVLHLPHNLVFLRHVTKDYEFVEYALAMMYTPTSFYCFTVDRNADELFKHRMRLLGRCIWNVLVSPVERDWNIPGELLRGHQDCYDMVTKYAWKHAVISQEEQIIAQSVKWMANRSSQLKEDSLIGSNRIPLERQLGNYSIDKPLVTSSFGRWWNNRSEPLIISRTMQPILYDFLTSDGVMQKIVEDASSANFTAKCRTEVRDKYGNCILGMEDYNAAARGNRAFVPARGDFDFGFVQCIHEAVFKKTYKEVL